MPTPLDDTFRVVNNESVDGTTLTNGDGKTDSVLLDKEGEVLSVDCNLDDGGSLLIISQLLLL